MISQGKSRKFYIPYCLALIILCEFVITKRADGQHLNTPPILIVPERNWRIPENEKIGQIIARVRAEDAENDELEFGLESHLLPNHLGSKETNKIPFRIEPIAGIVYLNESLLGRAGENFFLYVTVSDGQLTAKNEVFVNVLPANDVKDKSGLRAPSTSLSNTVQNISHYFPTFDKLPGVQTIRNFQPNHKISNSMPSDFDFKNGISASNYPFGVYVPIKVKETLRDNDTDSKEHDVTVNPIKTTNTRIKLLPVRKSNNTNAVGNKSSESLGNGIISNSANVYPLGSVIIFAVIIMCGLFSIIIGIFLWQKRKCLLSRDLKKKSKDVLSKKSNHHNLTDDSENSMVMHHWNGPTAYGNRYVPWERDQQQQQVVYTTSHHQSMEPSSQEPSNIGSSLNVRSSNVDMLGHVNAMSSGDSSNNNKTEYDQWEIPRYRLKFFNKLGEGAFGQVWRCEGIDIGGIEGITTVAVKTLKETADEIEKKDLISELEVMKTLEPNVNVVRLLGCCTDKEPIFVIIEYVNRGKLQTYLRNSRSERHYGNTHGDSKMLTSGDLTSFMYQVAKGMDYLTSKGIIHRDLAARNILITDDHICKIADFGFARDVLTSKIYERKSEGKLPIRWMAIESLYDNIFSSKSDIWSFGILMWEIVTLGSTPYPGISAADVMRKLRDGYRLEKPDHCRRELYNIMYYCWSHDPNQRPSFADLVQMLDKLLHTEKDYIELERFPDHNYYNIIHLSGEKL